MSGDFPTTWFHLTDRAKFKLDPRFTPADNAVAIEDRSGRPGIYLGKDVERWVNGFNYWRPFVVELRVDPSVLEDPGVHGRYGGELFVPATSFGKVTVVRVIPLDAYAREQYGEPGWIESRLGVEFDTGLPLPPRNQFGKYRPYRYSGPDVRAMTAAETSHLKKQLRQSGVRSQRDPAKTGARHRFRTSVHVRKNRASMQPNPLESSMKKRTRRSPKKPKTLSRAAFLKRMAAGKAKAARARGRGARRDPKRSAPGKHHVKHANMSHDAFVTHVLGDPRYAEHYHVPGWNLAPTVLMAHKLMFHVFPEKSKADHLATARAFEAAAHAEQIAHYKLLRESEARYGNEGGMISSGFYPNWPERVKDKVRYHAHALNYLKQAARAHAWAGENYNRFKH